jgi:hypothetical protein
MPDETAQKDKTSEQSASKALDATGREPAPDSRLMPGGAHGSTADVGMSGMDRKDVPSGAAKPDQLNAQDSPDGTI